MAAVRFPKPEVVGGWGFAPDPAVEAQDIPQTL